jgi:hypothetical protein
MLSHIYNDNNGVNLEIFDEVDGTYFYFVDEIDGEVKRHFTCSKDHASKYIREMTDFVKVWQRS